MFWNFLKFLRIIKNTVSYGITETWGLWVIEQQSALVDRIASCSSFCFIYFLFLLVLFLNKQD